MPKEHLDVLLYIIVCFVVHIVCFVVHIVCFVVHIVCFVVHIVCQVDVIGYSLVSY